MLAKKLSDLTLKDIEALRSNSVQESRFLEFKRDAIGNSDKEKREFLADVSAFANASGGDILLGLEAKEGVATDICGISVEDSDKEKLRLVDIIRHGLDPRLTGVDIASIPVADSRGVLVIRTPRSWIAPHRVVFNKDWNFYVRNAAGKHAMNTAELRQAFNLSENITTRIRAFRAERIDAIKAKDLPFPYSDHAKVVVHVAPLSAFTDPPDLQLDRRQPGIMLPWGTSHLRPLHALEGLFTLDSHDLTKSHVLMFRTGAVESSAGIETGMGQARQISLGLIENGVFHIWKCFSSYAKAFDIAPPFFVFVSLIGVKGLSLKMPWNSASDPTVLHKDKVLCPEVFVPAEKTNQEPGFILGRQLGIIANAFGLEKSFNTDADGKYKMLADGSSEMQC